MDQPLAQDSAPLPTPSGSSQPVAFTYDGKTARFYEIYIKGVLLTILTVGIYRFWFKTDLRRYQLSSFALEGDRFEYTGTPMEMLRGFFIALPIFLLLTIPLYSVDPLTSKLDDVLSTLFFYLIFVGQYAALRYRFSRTVWRGIRGRLRGSAFMYGGLVVLRYIGMFSTFGLIAPMLDMVLWRYKIKHASFGETPLVFDGSEKGLYGINFWTILLFPFTLGISRFWYTAALMNRQFDGTILNNARLGSTYTGGKLFGMVLSNGLLFICTLGLALPYITHRKMRFLAENIYIISNGPLDLTQVRQSQEALEKSGEGLDQIFDADIGFG